MAEASNRNDTERLPWSGRLALLAAGSLLVALLGTALWLTPDQRGYGTHQGLGLPPCTMRQLLDLRCPSCGMTTAWAHLVRGNLVASVRSNAGGTLLGLLALVAGPWALASGLRGRWLVRRPSEWTVAALASLAFVVTLADWSIRAWRGG